VKQQEPEPATETYLLAHTDELDEALQSSATQHCFRDLCPHH